VEEIRRHAGGQFDPELVEALASWYADREDLFRAAGAVGERPADVVPSGPQDHLLVAFGRRPDWKAG
jgi:hypothetical protein